MNLERVQKIAKAVLYEGYMLYPYRPSSVKNRRRWNFGLVYPRARAETSEGTEACSMKTECLIVGHANTLLEGRLRFLQLQMRTSGSNESKSVSTAPDGWQEAVEREVVVPEHSMERLCRESVILEFVFPKQICVASDVERRQESVEGKMEISAEKMREDLYKIGVRIENTTSIQNPSGDRDSSIMHAMVSTHTILGVNGGEFVSLLEMPAELKEFAETCQNVGAWPVLVGDPGERDTLLASPIILYDYPQIAPESPGDLFDGTEIDEILSLRIMTLTDEEKREIRESDERAREILDRTDSMPAEQFMKLHGAVRGMRPVGEKAS